MTVALLAGLSVLVLMLIVALLWGQPTSVDRAYDQVAEDATTIAACRAAIPTPTRRLPRYCPGWVEC